MTKQKLLLLFVVVCTIWNSTKAQSYSIESLEGAKIKIHLNETSSWYGATVSCLIDTLFLNDYAGVKEVRILRNKFLEIVYDTRGGSGSQFRNAMILSVIRNKINVSLLVTFFGKGFGGDIDGSLYLLKFIITGNDKNNYKLIAHIYDRHKSNNHPERNYVKNKQAILDFDPNQNIFYRAHKKITQLFTVNVPKKKPEKEEINEILPIIYLGTDAYYYIKGGWYTSGNDDALFKEYYK